jgi:hypothetical protein
MKVVFQLEKLLLIIKLADRQCGRYCNVGMLNSVQTYDMEKKTIFTVAHLMMIMHRI